MTKKISNSGRKSWLEGDIVLINGIRVRKAFLLGLVLPIALSLIVAFSVVAFLLWQDRRSVDATAVSIPEKEQQKVDEVEAATEISQTVQVLERHRKAIDMDDCESLVWEGVYTTRGLDFELSIFAKRPDLFRHRLAYQGVEIISAWDGHRYWEHNPTSELGDRAVVRHAINQAMLKMQASPASVLWHYLEKGSDVFSWIEQKESEGRICDILSHEGLLNVPVYHFIDAESGYEMRREATIMIGAEKMQISVQFQHATHEQPDEIKEPRLPMGYHLFLNDLLIAKASFKDYRLNRGVVSWMFERLEESPDPVKSL